jgi:protein required for attachment to host cells
VANTCVVVADGARARLFLVDTSEADKTRLVEMEDLVNTEYQARGRDVLPTARSTRNTSRQSGPVHPYAQRRLRHRLELEKRFAQDVAGKVAGLTQSWSRGSVILIAEPRMLGLLREAGRGVLKHGVTTKELAKDYTQLAVSELHEHLAESGIINSPAARPAQF